MTEKLAFTGRAFELNLLDRQYAEPLGALCVVYGRRRVGKTRLITHWLANRDIPGFYWLATDSAPGALLRSLSQALYRQLHGQPPADPGFTYYDWDELLRELARLASSSRQKQVIILDEFTYALKYRWLETEPVLAAFAARPTHQHLVVTGRGAPPELLALADTATEMGMVKHAFQAGLKAMPGMEW